MIAKAKKSKLLGVLIDRVGDLLDPWVCLVLRVTFYQTSIYLDDGREREGFIFCGIQSSRSINKL
jgi:hypothetical protein